VSVLPGVHVPPGHPLHDPQVQVAEHERVSLPPHVRVRVSVSPGVQEPLGQVLQLPHAHPL